MVEVGMGKQQIKRSRTINHHLPTQHSDAGTRINDDTMVATPDFDAGCVTAIANGVRPWGRNTSAYAPKPDRKFFFVRRFVWGSVHRRWHLNPSPKVILEVLYFLPHPPINQ